MFFPLFFSNKPSKGDRCWKSFLKEDKACCSIDYADVDVLD